MAPGMLARIYGKEYWVIITAGLLLGTLFSAASYLHVYLGPLVLVLFLAAYVIIRWPDTGVALFVFLVLVIEEFPSGYGETVERSLRTPFYGRSLGLPGFYATDLFLFLLPLLIIAHRYLARKPVGFDFRGYGRQLLVIAAVLVFSIVYSLVLRDPFLNSVIQVTTGTSYKVNPRGAEFIAFFQYKVFFYLFISYFLFYIYFDSPEKLEKLKRIFLAAIVAFLVLGFYRLLLYPEKILHMVPLFYHSPSSWLFALIIFYFILKWSFGSLRSRPLLVSGIVSVIFMLFILLSFRRTMWAAIFLSAIALLFFLPGRYRIRLLVAACGIGLLVGAAIMISPLGDKLLGVVSSRLSQTSVSDTSTLYRLALFVYFYEHFTELPILGYGVEPLWNKIVSLGYFRINLENIHSIYFWLLLRTGVLGFLIVLTAYMAMLVKLLGSVRNEDNPDHRAILICVFLALVMYLFSGIFNPVYSEARYMIVLGLGLAMASRIIQFSKVSRLAG